MTEVEERSARTFTAMLAAALVLTCVLAGLLVADLRAGRSGSGAGATAVAVDDTAATPAPDAPMATPVPDASAAPGAAAPGAAAPGAAGGGGGSGTAAPAHGGAAAAAAGGGGGAAAPPAGPCGDCIPAGAPISVGSIVTQTGPGRSTTLAHAVAAWARDLNRRGGLAGHPVALDLRDDGGNPDTGASQYRAIAQDDRALALVGECAPITDAQQVGFLAQAQLPDIGECQSSDAAYSSPWVFVAGPTPYQNGQLAAKLMRTTQGWQASNGQIALVCLDEAAVASTCKGAEDMYGDAALWSGHPQKEQIADNNYPQLISQWRSDGVKDVHLVLEPGNTQRYLAAAGDAGWSVPTIQDLAIDDSIGRAYPNAEGMFIGTPWTPLDQTGTPGMQRLTATLGAYYPDDRVDIYAQTGWLGCLIFEHAVQLLGPGGISKQRVVDALNTLHDWDTGLGPHVSYDPHHHVGDVENSLMQVKGAGSDQWRLVTAHGRIGL